MTFPALTTPAPSSGDDIPIDVDLIKVLASDTRRDVLRLLGERRHTLSELAEALGLKKATILEHLEKLVAAGLIRKIDDGERIWIYYELTHRGLRIVRPGRTTRFYLIMVSSAAAVVLVGALVAAATLGNLGGIRAGEDATSTDSLLADDARASVPLVVYRGFDDGVPIVLQNGAPPGSTLLVGGIELDVADGTATLGASDVDALPEGRHAIVLRTDAGDLALPSTLDVREPPVALLPLAIPEDAATQVVLSVGAPGMPTPANVTVLVDGAPVALADLGRERAFMLQIDRPQTLDVQIGRLVHRELAVLPHVGLAATHENGTLVLNVSDAATPLADARVLLGPNALGATDANGTLRTAWPAMGEHALSVLTADGRAIERAVRVGNDTLEELPARLTLAAYSDPGTQTLAALVDVTNLGVANETVTLVARMDGTPIASARADVAAGARSEARLTANVPLTAPVLIEAYGARGGAIALMGSQSGATFAESAAGGTASPPTPAAPMAAASPASNTSATRYYDADMAKVSFTLAGRAPDATTTLYPTASPTAATAFERSDAPAPAVPGPGLALVVLALVGAAVVGARRRT